MADEFSAKSRRRRQRRLFIKRLFRNKLSVLGLIFVLIVVLSAVFADFVAPYDYAKQSLPNAFLSPSAAHWFGTDNYGRDILSRVIFGGRISLLISLFAIAMSLVIGCFIGIVSGYFGGTVDGVLMRLMDVLMAIPAFLLALCISAALGTGTTQTAIAIAVGFIPGYARLMRSTVMSLRNQEFVEAAQMCGCSSMRVMLRHILPNTLSTIIVDSTLRIGAGIMLISSLSFIGLGVQPPTPEWGSMLAAAREYIRDYWFLVTFPGLAILVTLFGFNLLGDGLRDALDPRLKR